MKQTYLILGFYEYINLLEQNLGPLRDLGFEPLHFLQLMVFFWSDLITLDKAIEILMGYAVSHESFEEENVDLTELEDNLHIVFDEMERTLAKIYLPYLQGKKWQLVGLFQNDALVSEVNNDTIDATFDFL